MVNVLKTVRITGNVRAVNVLAMRAGPVMTARRKAKNARDHERETERETAREIVRATVAVIAVDEGVTDVVVRETAADGVERTGKEKGADDAETGDAVDVVDVEVCQSPFPSPVAVCCMLYAVC